MAHSRLPDADGRGRGHSHHQSERPRSNLPPFAGELGGHVFITNKEEMDENFARQVFGLPKQHAPTVLRIKEGLPLFLYNDSTHSLHGVYEASSDGGLNLQPDAWRDEELSARLKQPFSRFPAQVRFRVCSDRGWLAENKFRDILNYYYIDNSTERFRLPLTAEQANELLELFNMAPARAPVAAASPAPGPQEDAGKGDWEQVKSKARTKPAKADSHGRQGGSPTRPPTPRGRSEGSKPNHQGPVSNGDVSRDARIGRGADRWRQEGHEWRSRGGGKQSTGPVRGGREGFSRDGASKEGSESAGREGAHSKGEAKENGVLETGPGVHSLDRPAAQAGKEALLPAAQKPGILGSGVAAGLAEGSGRSEKERLTGREGTESSGPAGGRRTDAPVRPAAKPALKSSTFSYSAALKVGLPSRIELETSGADASAGSSAEKEAGEGEDSFPSLSRSSSRSDRVPKVSKKEEGAGSIPGKAEEHGGKDSEAKAGDLKTVGRSDAVESAEANLNGAAVDEERVGETGNTSLDTASHLEEGEKGIGSGEKTNVPRSKGDVSPSVESPKKNDTAKAPELSPEQVAERPPAVKAGPVKVVEVPNPWGKPPMPVEPVSIAELQQEEQEVGRAEHSGAVRRDASVGPLAGVREGATRGEDRWLDPSGWQEGEILVRELRPVGRGWEARKPEVHRPVRVQAPPHGGSGHGPTNKPKGSPQPFANMPSRRGDQVPVNDLSALPPSAPERIQQRSMGSLGSGPSRNRTPPLVYHSHRPQPVQVPAPQPHGAAVRVSPTAAPYTPNTDGFTPSAPPFTPSAGWISPGHRSYNQPGGVLQTPPPMFVQQQSDGSLTFVPPPINGQNWRMPGGRFAGPPRANGLPAGMVYSPTTPSGYGYALSALSPPSQPGTPLGSPSLPPPMFLPGGHLAPPPPELLANAAVLHGEVLRYAHKARKTPEARARAESAVLCVRNAIRALWPASDVEVFGSFSTGLCLLHSDVDLAIVGAPPIPPELANDPRSRPLVPLIRELASALRKRPWLERLTTIETASMPVIKLRCKPGRDSRTAVKKAERQCPNGAEKLGSNCEGSQENEIGAENTSEDRGVGRSGGDAEAVGRIDEHKGADRHDSAKGGEGTIGSDVKEGASPRGVNNDVSQPGSREHDDVTSSSSGRNEDGSRGDDDGSKRGSGADDDVSERSAEPPAVAIDITIMGQRGQPIGKDRKQEGPPPKSQHNGASARQFVIERLQELPALAPLVLLLKSYLHHRGLNDVYTGGLGSFSLTLMLVFYLERVATNPMEIASSSGARNTGNGASGSGNASSPPPTRHGAEITEEKSDEPSTSCSPSLPSTSTHVEVEQSGGKTQHCERSAPTTGTSSERIEGEAASIRPDNGEPSGDGKTETAGGKDGTAGGEDATAGGESATAGGEERTAGEVTDAEVVGMKQTRDWLAAGPMPNLGVLLIGFLHLFGNELDLATVRLVLKTNSQNGGIFYHDRLTRPVALWIDDPLRPGANIGAGSFAMYNVQAALREMLKFLTTPREALPQSDNKPALIDQLFSQVYPERSSS